MNKLLLAAVLACLSVPILAKSPEPAPSQVITEQATPQVAPASDASDKPAAPDASAKQSTSESKTGGSKTDASAATVRANPEQATGKGEKAIVFSERDMVVTANPHASKAALKILADGGSAVDAAIAAQLVLNLVEPQSSGIGGGAFMLAFDGQARRVRVFDGRETAPAAAKPDQFLKDNGAKMKFFDAVDSGMSVGVPGLLRMLDLAHRAQGKLPWKDLFAAAITLAENGFEISPRLHKSINGAIKRIAAQPAAAEYFLDKGGRAKAVGTVLRNPEFARVLSEVARDGADAFYNGDTAEAIVAAVASHNRRPGQIGADDLRSYRAVERSPLCGSYRGRRICGMPPPSSGALTVLQTLALLEQFDLASMASDSVQAVHLISEAYRLAYADRARYIADPGFVDVPVKGLLDDAYTKARAGMISDTDSLGKPVPGAPSGAQRAGADETRELPGTSHLSIVDAQGNAVSMTSSIETAFGSLLLVRGFLLNNQLTDFSFRPADDEGAMIANRVEAGKRPRSSMAPTIVLNEQGQLEGVLGSPGGSSIIQYVAGTLIAMIDWGMDVQQAINAPHFGAKTSKTTTLEADTALAKLREQLAALGHKIKLRPLTSGLHAIVFNGVREDGTLGGLANGSKRSKWAGGADPRREGLAIGN